MRAFRLRCPLPRLRYNTATHEGSGRPDSNRDLLALTATVPRRESNRNCYSEGASMAPLTAQQITKAGITPAYSAVSASDTLTPDSIGMFLHVKNAGGSSDTVTLDDAGTTAGGNSPIDPTVTVPATTGDKMIYIPPSFVNQATGTITITHSFITSVTCALFRVV